MRIREQAKREQLIRDGCQWVEQNRAVVGDVMPAYDGAMEPATWNNLAGAGLR